MQKCAYKAQNFHLVIGRQEHLQYLHCALVMSTKGRGLILQHVPRNAKCDEVRVCHEKLGRLTVSALAFYPTMSV